MPRALSSAAKQAIYAQETSQAAFCLITITGVGIGTPLRFVNNQQDVTSRGNTYIATAFSIALPDERDDAPPRVTLSLDNVDRAMIPTIRTLTQAPTVALEIVFSGTPETVEAGPFNFTLRNVDYTADLISGDLFFEDFLNESFPADSFSPNNFPGLF